MYWYHLRIFHTHCPSPGITPTYSPSNSSKRHKTFTPSVRDYHSQRCNKNRADIFAPHFPHVSPTITLTPTPRYFRFCAFFLSPIHHASCAAKNQPFHRKPRASCASNEFMKVFTRPAFWTVPRRTGFWPKTASPRAQVKNDIEQTPASVSWCKKKLLFLSWSLGVPRGLRFFALNEFCLRAIEH